MSNPSVAWVGHVKQNPGERKLKVSVECPELSKDGPLLIVEYGRWDDNLRSLRDTDLDSQTAAVIKAVNEAGYDIVPNSNLEMFTDQANITTLTVRFGTFTIAPTQQKEEE